MLLLVKRGSKGPVIGHGPTVFCPIPSASFFISHQSTLPCRSTPFLASILGALSVVTGIKSLLRKTADVFNYDKISLNCVVGKNITIQILHLISERSNLDQPLSTRGPKSDLRFTRRGRRIVPSKFLPRAKWKAFFGPRSLVKIKAA